MYENECTYVHALVRRELSNDANVCKLVRDFHESLAAHGEDGGKLLNLEALCSRVGCCVSNFLNSKRVPRSQYSKELTLLGLFSLKIYFLQTPCLYVAVILLFSGKGFDTKRSSVFSSACCTQYSYIYLNFKQISSNLLITSIFKLILNLILHIKN